MDSGKNRDCLTSLFIPIIQAIARPKHGQGCTIRDLNTECVIRWIVIERVPVCPGFRHGSSWRVGKEVLSPLNILLCVSDATAYSTLFWDGRESELKVVALQAFTNPREMGLPDEAALLKQINTQERYARFAKGRPLNQSDIAEGLTQYLRSLPRQPTRYDRSIGEPSLLSMDERAGLALFAGKVACTECHLLAGVWHRKQAMREFSSAHRPSAHVDSGRNSRPPAHASLAAAPAIIDDKPTNLLPHHQQLLLRGPHMALLEREWHRIPERYRSPTPIAILNWGDNPEPVVSLA